MRKTLLLIAVILLHHCFNLLVAQDAKGIRDSLQSEVLKEKRIFEIFLPEAYDPNISYKYDVIYVLDGDWGNTKVTLFAYQFLLKERFMPPSIIVSIHNARDEGANLRDRDFTPTVIQGNKRAGYAANFLAFLKNDLIPHINKSYTTSGDATLFGHSLGGLFAMYAFLNEPDLFQSYLAADPSFWWDNNYMTAYTRKKLDSLQGVKKSLFICGRGGRNSVGMGIPSIDSVLREKAPGGLIWRSIDYPGETHNSIQYKAVYDGLKFFYAGYGTMRVAFHPMNGIVLKNKPVRVWYGDEMTSTFYTTDGTEPTSRSIPIQTELMLNGPATLKVKVLSTRKIYKEQTGIFKEGKTLKSLSKPKDVKQGGLNYSCYEASWDKLSDLKQLTPVKTGILDSSFRINTLPRDKEMILVLEGYIDVAKDGYYVFAIEADDKTRLYVGEQLLDRDGPKGSFNAVSYVLPLEKGFHPVRLEYSLKMGNFRMNVLYVTPDDSNPKPIPLSIQYSR